MLHTLHDQILDLLEKAMGSPSSGPYPVDVSVNETNDNCLGAPQDCTPRTRAVQVCHNQPLGSLKHKLPYFADLRLWK